MLVDLETAVLSSQVVINVLVLSLDKIVSQ